MARGKCTFRKRDLEMAVRAVKDGGCEVTCVRVTRDGAFDLIIGKPAEPANTDSTANPWDEAP
jgi:hypothetical protein